MGCGSSQTAQSQPIPIVPTANTTPTTSAKQTGLQRQATLLKRSTLTESLPAQVITPSSPQPSPPPSSSHAPQSVPPTPKDAPTGTLHPRPSTSTNTGGSAAAPSTPQKMSGIERQRTLLARVSSMKVGATATPTTPVAAANPHLPPALALPLSPTANGTAPLTKAPTHLAPLKSPTHLAPLKGLGGQSGSLVPQQPLPPTTPTGTTQPAQQFALCDADASHGYATVYCDDCEESFCGPCDITLHSRKKTADHEREPIAGVPVSSPPPSAAPSPMSPNRHIPAISPPTVAPSPSTTPRTSFAGAAAAVVASAPPVSNKKRMTVPTPPTPASPTEQKESITRAPSTAGPPKQAYVRQSTMKTVQAGTPIIAEGDKAIHRIPVETLRALGTAQLNIIWAQYDTDGNGVLDKRELKLLASDCIERTNRMFADEIRRQVPGISESDLAAAVKKERALMSGGKTGDEAHKAMVNMLVKKLDVNGDGSVTKAELMMQWNAMSKELFQVRTEGALDCSIM